MALETSQIFLPMVCACDLLRFSILLSPVPHQGSCGDADGGPRVTMRARTRVCVCVVPACPLSLSIVLPSGADFVLSSFFFFFFLLFFLSCSSRCVCVLCFAVFCFVLLCLIENCTTSIIAYTCPVVSGWTLLARILGGEGQIEHLGCVWGAFWPRDRVALGYSSELRIYVTGVVVSDLFALLYVLCV